MMRKNMACKKKPMNFKQAQHDIKSNVSFTLNLYLNSASRSPLLIQDQQIVNDYLKNGLRFVMTLIFIISTMPIL